MSTAWVCVPNLTNVRVLLNLTNSRSQNSYTTYTAYTTLTRLTFSFRTHANDLSLDNVSAMETGMNTELWINGNFDMGDLTHICPIS
jgi:hypothetical protein